MFEIDYAQFVEDWENGLIQDVVGAGSFLHGKSVKGQADNPDGYVMVYCVVPSNDDVSQVQASTPKTQAYQAAQSAKLGLASDSKKEVA